ncbi:follistatin-like [Asterias amurensis]|uniref:follistatin-like n=1 Tax=Asterias amurensis TaxID=7602 RepID=UPI003AB430F4
MKTLQRIVVAVMPCVAVAFALLVLSLPVHGLSCWGLRENGSGTCELLIQENVTMEECCSHNGESISFSTLENLGPGEVFWYKTLYGGVPNCNLCEKTCKQTQCKDGRKCVIKGGRPRCVCKPDCAQSENSTSHRGPVCATNGKEYKSMCAFLKMKCRQQDQYLELDVAYNGPCQNSCDSVACLGTHKCCVEDQHGRPHCVSSSAISCPGPFRDAFVCGADGVTYETLCQLRRTSCSRGAIVPVSHTGKCEALTSCNSTSCVNRKECYWDHPANTSRCILCNYDCNGWPDEVPLCASDGKTYQSWCEMQEHICQTHEYAEVLAWGVCDEYGQPLYTPDDGSGYSMFDSGYSQIDFTPSSRQILDNLRSSMYNSQGRDDENATTTESSMFNTTQQIDGTLDPVTPQIPAPEADGGDVIGNEEIENP